MSARPKSLFAFKGPITGASTRLALRGIAGLYMVLPVLVVGGFLDEHRVRSWPVFLVGLGLFAAVGLSNIVDVARLARSRLDHFSAAKALLQILLAVTALGLIVGGTGLHGGASLLLLVAPFLAAALLGNGRMIAIAWVWLTATLAVVTGLLVGGGEAVWLTLAFSLTSLGIATMVHTMIRGTVTSMALNQVLAEIAVGAGSLRRWPDDLTPLGERIAHILDLDSYAVVVRPSNGRPLDVSFRWPDAGSGHSMAPAEAVLVERALEPSALEARRPVVSERLFALAVAAGSTAVAIVAPERSRHGVQVNFTVTRITGALLATMYERSLMLEALTDRANTDDLTRLPNRRVLFEELEREIGRHRRNHRPLSVAMLDLDHFKAYNDRFGHALGDLLLRTFADTLASRIRSQDTLARYGGEEFVLVLPDTDRPGAEDLVEQLRRLGAGEGPDGERVTFSAGLATWDGAESVDELLARADIACYAAKNAGRDRIVANA